jgi:hypothetical protein
LGIPLSYISYLISYYIAQVISLLFADQLALEGALSTWHFRMWDKYEHLQIFKALQLITSSSNPVLSLWRGKSLCPGRFIIGV